MNATRTLESTKRVESSGTTGLTVLTNERSIMPSVAMWIEVRHMGSRYAVWLCAAGDRPRMLAYSAELPRVSEITSAFTQYGWDIRWLVPRPTAAPIAES